MWTTRSRAWERHFVCECEAFLTGHYAESLRKDKQPIPGWVRLNVLAHGNEMEIAALASSEAVETTPSGDSVWNQALAFLAQELVGQVARLHRPLADLQCATLVPLELEMAARRTPSPLTPAMFVARVLNALSAHPSSQCG